MGTQWCCDAAAMSAFDPKRTVPVATKDYCTPPAVLRPIVLSGAFDLSQHGLLDRRYDHTSKMPIGTDVNVRTGQRGGIVSLEYDQAPDGNDDTLDYRPASGTGG